MAGGPPGSGGIKKRRRGPKPSGAITPYTRFSFTYPTKRHFPVTQSGEQISKAGKRLSRLFWRVCWALFPVPAPPAQPLFLGEASEAAGEAPSEYSWSGCEGRAQVPRGPALIEQA